MYTNGILVFTYVYYFIQKVALRSKNRKTCGSAEATARAVATGRAVRRRIVVPACGGACLPACGGPVAAGPWNIETGAGVSALTGVDDGRCRSSLVVGRLARWVAVDRSFASRLVARVGQHQPSTLQTVRGLWRCLLHTAGAAVAESPGALQLSAMAGAAASVTTTR